MLPMNTLPNGKQISILGFGCSSIWAKAAFPEHQAAEILRTASQEGINHFDTGPSYGFGNAEGRLGRFLGHRERGDYVISTKVGTIVANGGKLAKDFSPLGMEETLTGSLLRLGTDQVDILYLHGPSVSELNDEVYRFFEREKRRGRIVYSGINSFDQTVINRFLDTPIDAVMLQYNVADLSCLDILQELRSRRKIVIAGTVLARGVTRISNFFPTSAPRLWYLARALKSDPLFMARGIRIAKVLAKFNLTEPADALKIVTSDDRITSGVFGSSRAEHVTENARAARVRLAPEIRAQIIASLRR
jgi:aryl-alcohol dehydrogenase-like predicted oxidoreductase